MISINTPNVRVGLRVQSEATGNVGTITEYDPYYVEVPEAPKYNRQGWMRIVWDTHNKDSVHCLYDPDYGPADGEGAMFNKITIIDPSWKGNITNN